MPCHRSRKPDLNGPQSGPGTPPQSIEMPTPEPFVRTPPPGATTPPPAPTSAAAGEAAGAGTNTSPSLGAQLLSRLNPLARGEGR